MVRRDPSGNDAQLEAKLGWPSSLTAHFEAELRANFSDAWVAGYESGIARMTNDSKDRHVAAAAVHDHAQIIVTFNLRHFKPEHLDSFGIRVLHPQGFLVELFQQEQELVTTKLKQQASDRGRRLDQLLKTLSASVPGFVELVASSM